MHLIFLLQCMIFLQNLYSFAKIMRATSCCSARFYFKSLCIIEDYAADRRQTPDSEHTSIVCFGGV